MAGTGPSRAREEVIVLSAIDFFTGATLLHTLVCPARPVTDWRTAITGVTARAMAAAVARGEALAGREAAVAALWTVVDSETIVVGHAVWHDLRALGVSCARVVDSAVLTAEAAGVVAEGERADVYGDGWDDDDGDEVLRWEDVVDWDMWPKSPPDWSD
ncbi:9bd9befe-3c2a-43f5-95fe-aa376f284070 [Thermothielavioides terrestris]|uniref:9bd9befe-3c2a-43f5-95fe-aa376f284070 n=1 Tax=Thermothielavioides terrestris TaxID=2587410 RepID=A0A446BBJ1_9PEZI|nr:9bd9befe-3c2a-43f5-95fe-aa376f284070 [Thermothielavioides terrestris]